MAKPTVSTARPSNASHLRVLSVALLALFAANLSAQSPAVSAPPTSARVFDQIQEMTAALSEITGWKPRRKVPSEILTKEKFRQYVESQTKGRSREKEIHAEELALKMFGLVPQDFNLAGELVDLLDEQAAAFYDYRKKRLYVLNTTREGEDQRAALVHELAHALADQQHPLGKYLNAAGNDSDAATAREAVMEGQATWLSWAYENKKLNGRAEVPPRLLERLTAESDVNPNYPVLSAAPLYVRESLLFPYNAGARFQDGVYRKMGQRAFEAVFARGPISTQQIIHPDTYLNETAPSNPVPPSLDGSGVRTRDFELLIEGSVGEFDHEVLLRQYTSREASETAEHWRGGTFRVYENKKQKYPVLAYVSEWDSEDAAKTYFELYKHVLRAKWKGMQVASHTNSEVAGAGDSGNFTLRISGKTVQSVEGLGGPTTDRTPETPGTAPSPGAAPSRTVPKTNPTPHPPTDIGNLPPIAVN